MNQNLLFGLLFAGLILISWMGGWWMASRYSQQMANAYANLLEQVADLETNYKSISRENDKLKDRLSYLEKKYDQAIQELARLNSLYAEDLR